MAAAQQTQASVDQLAEALKREQEELLDTGVEDASEDAVQAIEQRSLLLDQQWRELDRSERRLAAEVQGAKRSAPCR